MYWLERVMAFHDRGYNARYYWNARWRRWMLFPAYATKYQTKRNAQAALRRRVKAGCSGVEIGGE